MNTAPPHPGQWGVQRHGQGLQQDDQENAGAGREQRSGVPTGDHTCQYRDEDVENDV